MNSRLILVAPSKRYGSYYFGDLWYSKNPMVTRVIFDRNFEPDRLEGYMNATILVAPDIREIDPYVKRLTSCNVIKL